MFARILAACLGCLAGLAVAADGDPVFEVWPPAPDAGSVLRVRVSGQWPDGCVPELDDARIDGRDIVVVGRVPERDCEPGGHPFRVATDALPLGRLKLAANGVYRLRFEVRRGESAPRLRAFQLFYVGNTPDPGYVPETGFWWPERGGEHVAGPGLGVQMEVQSGTLSITGFGYDAQGDSRWYVGAGPMQGQVARIELSQLGQGAGPFEAYRAPGAMTVVGQVHLEMHGPSRATLWFVSPAADGGLQVRPISMVRFRFAREAVAAWRGRWVVLAEREDGYPTLRIDFTRLSRSSSSFTLSDDDGEYRLHCVTEPRRPNSPPPRCQLHSKTDAGLDVDFDHIALNELRGWTGAGQRIVALKLNR